MFFCFPSHMSMRLSSSSFSFIRIHSNSANEHTNKSTQCSSNRDNIFLLTENRIGMKIEGKKGRGKERCCGCERVGKMKSVGSSLMEEEARWKGREKSVILLGRQQNTENNKITGIHTRKKSKTNEQAWEQHAKENENEKTQKEKSNKLTRRPTVQNAKHKIAEN